MQEINSLLNSLGQSDHHHHQIQTQPSMHHFGHNDDFIDQMLSSVLKSPWDSLSGNNYLDEPALLASKLRHHQISPSSFTTPNQGGDGSGQGLHDQTYGQPVSTAPAQPKQRVRAKRGQATDPHSIAERLRRERIAGRMKELQELVPNANKTDKASMLDEIIDYVKFLQLQVKVLSVSRLGGAAVADISSQDRVEAGKDSLTATEHQVAKLMEEDMGSAMQYLQGKGLCLMPISLATAISTSTRNPNPINLVAAAKDAASVSKP